ncbi:APC family permease [Clostridium luticellarii]|jgi:amino acid transporter|uniref:Low-affinity putrescine importer PlaP n=1 Tax=Clostridium luticellarii TaxID=1691940 RepID=A0A2T0BNN6_9CLOT|nr:amino acid permease [Clostridium luticellarii]MCI1944395.1 amino acid permease [Clostridium luticellarii]MCI1969167.1 amino acid permease [Clostridium luticellarii]MCI1995027.1 amino acid permease [Clostridium luticellarii]MCI2039534.1 amino acid permease [Clostridium luticellarii]PRR85476.1 Low-affinity putrescine importer PlaP [Clostridium luticellarii]
MKNTESNLGNSIESNSYKQELKRNLKLFSSFAVAFSFISITTGIFANYKFVISTAGPAGIWSWVIAFIGQLLVALIFAELSGVIPVSGYSYQWIKRLSNNMMGWIIGWVCICFLVLVVPAIDSGLAPIVASLFGLAGTPSQITMIVVATLIIQAAINIIGVKLAAFINNAAVFTESIGIISLTVILLAISLKNGNNPSILFNTANTGEGMSYIKPFMMSMLMGSFTLVGFESAANLSEETINANKTVPKAVVGSVLIAGIFGTFFLIAVTLGIKNLPAAIASNSPLPYILQSNLGNAIGTLFLIIVTISIFACGTVAMTSGSRLVYVMSRDNAFFLSNLFRKVSPKTSSPIYATVLILIFGVIATLFSSSLTTLIGVTAILPAIIYFTTIICYGLTRKKVKIEEGSFNLGRAAKPVFISAVVWLVFELAILTLPSDFHKTALVSIVLILIGFVLYFAVFKKRTEIEGNFEIEKKEAAN